MPLSVLRGAQRGGVGRQLFYLLIASSSLGYRNDGIPTFYQYYAEVFRHHRVQIQLTKALFTVEIAFRRWRERKVIQYSFRFDFPTLTSRRSHLHVLEITFRIQDVPRG